MFDFRRLILLFSIMFMGIVGVKANPKYYVVLASQNGKGSESVLCSACLSESDEHLNGDMYLIKHPFVRCVSITEEIDNVGKFRKRIVDDGGDCKYLCENKRKKKLGGCYFTVVDDENTDIKRLCLACMLKSVGFKNLIDVKELNAMFGGDSLVDCINQFGPHKEYWIKFLRCVCVRFSNLDDLKNPNCDLCLTEGEISEAGEHKTACDICIDNNDVRKNHVLLRCIKCSYKIHYGCLIQWMQAKKRLFCPNCQSESFENLELYIAIPTVQYLVN